MTHRDQDRENHAAALMELLGEDGFFVLVDNFPGVDVFAPEDLTKSNLPNVLGLDVTRKLSEVYRRNYIPVPLARTFRARRYRASGMSNRDIALRLGLTQSAVEKIFNREKKAGRQIRSPRDRNQLDLFD